MDRNTIAAITTDLLNCNSKDQVNLIKKRYEAYNHPYKYYILGSAYDLHNDNQNAFHNYLNAAKFGIVYPNDFYNTYFSDSIGSSLYYLLKRYNYNQLNAEIIRKMFFISYIYLTDTIHFAQKLNIKAFESLENRAYLLAKFEHGYSQLLCGEYLNPFTFGNVLFISDFYYAFEAYQEKGDIHRANILFENAKKIHNSLEDVNIEGIPASEYSLPEIADKGRDRHEFINQNIQRPFFNGEFNINEEFYLRELTKSVQLS